MGGKWLERELGKNWLEREYLGHEPTAADAGPCDQEQHEADGGKGQCIHLRKGKKSACGRADAPPVYGRLVDVGVCDAQHGETSADSYRHRIGFASDPQWVTCSACRDAMGKAPSVSREG